MKPYTLAAMVALVALWSVPLAAQYATPAYGYAVPVAYPAVAPSAPASCPPRQGAQALVPCQFSDRIDSQGFRWDVEQQGCVQQGTDGCFNDAFFLSINCNGRSSPFGQFAVQPMMTADGREYVIQGNGQAMGVPLEVTRRIKVDSKTAGIRYVDVFRNVGPVPLTVGIAININSRSGQFQSMMTDAGGTTPTALAKRETGVVLFGQPGSNQLSVAFYLAGAKSSVKPSIAASNPMQYVLSYNFTVPAGKTAAIAYGAAQCRLASPPDAKGVAAMLKPFGTRRWVRDLPAEIRKAIVNLGGGGLGNDDWDDAPLLDLAALEIVQGPSDVLALGSQTRLKGAAACAALTLRTRYGTMKTTLDEVLAVLGPRRPGGPSHIFLRDGQVLGGQLLVEDLKFTTNAGLEIALKPEALDRLVMRAGNAAKKPPAEVFAMLQTVEGERLALVRGGPSKPDAQARDASGPRSPSPPAPLPEGEGRVLSAPPAHEGEGRILSSPPAPEGEGRVLAASTPWGRLQFSVEEVARLSSCSEELGHRIVLRDGTRMFGYLDPLNLRLPTLTFGPQSFSPLDIREVRALDIKETAEGHDVPTTAHIELTGENRLIGQVDAAAIPFVVAGQKIAVPPGQIRHLRASEHDIGGTPALPYAGGTPAPLVPPTSPYAGGTPTPVYTPGLPMRPYTIGAPTPPSAGGTPMPLHVAEGSEPTGEFEGEMWDGGTLSGRIASMVLPVRSGGSVWQIPVRDIVEIHVPTPAVSEATRTRIGELIRDLGHPEYEKRKAAAAALADLGLLAKPQLSEAARQTADPEVRRAAETLLEDMKE